MSLTVVQSRLAYLTDNHNLPELLYGTEAAHCTIEQLENLFTV